MLLNIFVRVLDILYNSVLQAAVLPLPWTPDSPLVFSLPFSPALIRVHSQLCNLLSAVHVFMSVTLLRHVVIVMTCLLYLFGYLLCHVFLSKLGSQIYLFSILCLFLYLSYLFSSMSVICWFLLITFFLGCCSFWGFGLYRLSDSIVLQSLVSGSCWAIYCYTSSDYFDFVNDFLLLHCCYLSWD